MLAKALANLASTHSMDSNFDSPYALEARSKVIAFLKSNVIVENCFLPMNRGCL